MTEAVESSSRKGNLIDFIKRNQILSFILITVIISYFIGVPYQMWTGEFFEVTTGFASLYFQRLTIVYGPGLAAISITYLTVGKIGVKNLIRGLKPSKKYWKWYLVLPIFPFAITFTSFFIGGVSLEHLFSVTEDNWIILIGHLVLQTLIIGIGEELGWRGWLLPKLANKYPLGISILFMALIWGVWHFPILFRGPAIVIPWILMLFSLSIVFTWIWLRVKGAVSVLALAHASVNSTQFFLENELSKEYAHLILNSWEVNGYLYLALGICFLFPLGRHFNFQLKMNDVQPKKN